MDNLVLLGVLLILTVVVGSFLGIFAFAEVKSLRGEVRRLRQAVESPGFLEKGSTLVF